MKFKQFTILWGINVPEISLRYMLLGVWKTLLRYSVLVCSQSEVFWLVMIPEFEQPAGSIVGPGETPNRGSEPSESIFRCTGDDSSASGIRCELGRDQVIENDKTLCTCGTAAGKNVLNQARRAWGD